MDFRFVCLSVWFVGLSVFLKYKKLQYTRNWVALIAHGMDTNHDLRISPTELSESSDLLMKAVSHFIDAPNLNDEIYDFCKKEFFYVPPEVCCCSLSISLLFCFSITRRYFRHENVRHPKE